MNNENKQIVSSSCVSELFHTFLNADPEDYKTSQNEVQVLWTLLNKTLF